MSFDVGVLSSIMYPFIYVLELISVIEIDLSSVNVTCLGAQAPIEFLVNVFVALTVVVFIESGIHEAQTAYVMDANGSFLEASLLYDMELGAFRRLSAILCSILFQAFYSFSPILKLLQLWAPLF